MRFLFCVKFVYLLYEKIYFDAFYLNYIYVFSKFSRWWLFQISGHVAGNENGGILSLTDVKR